MKLPAFNHAEMEWDSWRAFHIDAPRVRQVHSVRHRRVCRVDSNWRPENRQVYKELNIQIVATDDDDCPKLYIPGSDKPVPKSHLNTRAMQTLLLDFDHKRAVGHRRLPDQRQRAAGPGTVYQQQFAQRLCLVRRHLRCASRSLVTRHYPRAIDTRRAQAHQRACGCGQGVAAHAARSRGA